MIGGWMGGQFLPEWPFAARFGYNDTWRLIFLMIGAPGILAGLLLPLLLHDGRRQPQAPKVGEPSTRSWAPVFTALFANSGFLRNYQFAMAMRSEEHTSELQSLMRISYAVF